MKKPKINNRGATAIQYCRVIQKKADLEIKLKNSIYYQNMYLKGFVMTAIVQLPGYVYVICTLERKEFGRKRSMCAFLLLSGICLCIHPLLKKKSLTISVIVSVFGRFCANCSYTILNLFSAEQFPTVIR